jgi:hypothetical protein
MLGRPWVSTSKYLAVYELETSDEAAQQAMLAQTAERVADGRILMSPAFDASAATSALFNRISPRVEAVQR